MYNQTMESTQYAIISTGGKQYRVRPGDTVSIEKIYGVPGDEVAFNEVLLVSVGNDIKLGAPHVAGVSVFAEIIAQRKDKKKIHFRYKNKTRQGTRRGHRQKLTDVTIKSIVEVEHDETGQIGGE